VFHDHAGPSQTGGQLERCRAGYSLVVSTAWLATHLADPDLVVPRVAIPPRTPSGTSPNADW